MSRPIRLRLPPPPRARPGLVTLPDSLVRTLEPLRGFGAVLGGLAVLVVAVAAAPTISGWKSPTPTTHVAEAGALRPIDPGDAHGAPAGSDAGARSGPACPAGWEPLGSFRVSSYVLADERDFPEEPRVEAPCGLEGSYRADFLYGRGVRMQGSGRTADGRIVRYVGGGCFAEAACAWTASGTCADADRTVAVDPETVPLGSSLWIEGLGERVAEDTGGAVSGRHVDVYEGTGLTVEEAREVGISRRVVCIPSA